MSDQYNIKKNATNIYEPARRELGITRDQYALCQYVTYRSADSRQRMAGWCCDKKEDVAEFIGITRVGLFKMAKQMEAFGLIEISEFGYFRATSKWIDTESQCKQSLQESTRSDVNKVYTGRKQSLQELRKSRKQSLQTPIYSMSIYSKSEEEEKFGNNANHSAGRFKEEEKEKKGRTGPARPQNFVSGRVDSDAEIEAMKDDFRIREAFTMSRKVPAEKFDSYLDLFRVEIGAREKTYFKRSDLREHFLSFAASKFKIETAQSKGIKKTANERFADSLREAYESIDAKQFEY